MDEIMAKFNNLPSNDQTVVQLQAFRSGRKGLEQLGHQSTEGLTDALRDVRNRHGSQDLRGI